MLIVEGNQYMVARRMFQGQLCEKPKFLFASQGGRVRSGLFTHVAASPLITLIWRNRAGEAAWVIQPDCPGWPFPHVMNP
jgi:hypothetical protein